MNFILTPSYSIFNSVTKDLLTPQHKVQPPQHDISVPLYELLAPLGQLAQELHNHLQELDLDKDRWQGGRRSRRSGIRILSGKWIIEWGYLTIVGDMVSGVLAVLSSSSNCAVILCSWLSSSADLEQLHFDGHGRDVKIKPIRLHYRYPLTNHRKGNWQLVLWSAPTYNNTTLYALLWPLMLQAWYCMHQMWIRGFREKTDWRNTCTTQWESGFISSSGERKCPS